MPNPWEKFNDYLNEHDWKKKYVQEYPSIAERDEIARHQKEIETLYDRIRRLSDMVDSAEDELDASRNVIVILLDELHKNKLMMFLLIRNPNILKLLREAGHDTSDLENMIKEFQNGD